MPVTALVVLALYQRVEDMTLAEQLGRLRQLAVTDPETSVLPPAIINALDELADAIQLAVTNPESSVLSLVIINALDELTEAIQQLRGDNAGRELGSV
jgi:flagellar hook-associated protein FlgK